VASDEVTDSNPDMLDSTTTTLTLNRYRDIKGPGHIRSTATVVGEAEPYTIVDRDLGAGEEVILLNTIALIKALGHTGDEALGEAFAVITDGMFLAFCSYCHGVVTGAQAIQHLARASSAVEALVRLYELDPLAAMRKTYGVGES